MWQTIIIVTIALAFKAAAAYAEKKKKAEEAAKRERSQNVGVRTQFKARSAPTTSVRIPIVSTAAPAPKAATSPNVFFDSIVDALRSHTPQKTSELHSAEGEATATQLAKTVEMIRSGVLRSAADNKPVANVRRGVKPAGRTSTPVQSGFGERIVMTGGEK